MSMTPDEMRQRIEAAPFPMEGPPIHSRDLPGMEGYELAAMCAARAMLIVSEADPSLLAVPGDDPRGINAAFHDAHWKAAEARWPGLDAWLGGLTGFMFGWANNAVRYVLSAPQVGNPAILSVG